MRERVSESERSETKDLTPHSGSTNTGGPSYFFRTHYFLYPLKHHHLSRGNKSA